MNSTYQTKDGREPITAAETKVAFEAYFEVVGKRNFKQFYYDWHIDAMVEPFAE